MFSTKIKCGEDTYSFTWHDIDWLDTQLLPDNYLAIKVDVQKILPTYGEAVAWEGNKLHSYYLENREGRWYCPFYNAYLFLMDGDWHIIVPIA